MFVKGFMFLEMETDKHLTDVLPLCTEANFIYNFNCKGHHNQSLKMLVYIKNKNPWKHRNELWPSCRRRYRHAVFKLLSCQCGASGVHEMTYVNTQLVRSCTLSHGKCNVCLVPILDQ